MRVAIVHYWLVGRGGGEKVLEAICDIYPDADIYTHCLNKKSLSDAIKTHKINTTFINKLPFSKKLYKLYLPFMPLALKRLDLSQYDLVISSESGPAKGVVTRPGTRHICYCHTPMRYLWEQQDLYMKSYNVLIRFFMALLFPSLRRWDVASAQLPDAIVANSHAVADKIKRWWGRDSTVIHPPVDTKFFSKFLRDNPEDYYLFAGRLVRYKRADLAIKACNKLGKKLFVIGEGAEEKALKSIAGPNVTFTGRITKENLAKLYSGCKALLFPGEEDFGIVPVEVLSTGRPVIAFHKGGALDYVNDNTGIFFDKDDVDSLADAIMKFETKQGEFDPRAISNSTNSFSEKSFKDAVITLFEKHNCIRQLVKK
nr:glycosyltransferase [uncultured Pseudodesulfovibrio sp.]